MWTTNTNQQITNISSTKKFKSTLTSGECRVLVETRLNNRLTEKWIPSVKHMKFISVKKKNPPSLFYLTNYLIRKSQNYNLDLTVENVRFISSNGFKFDTPIYNQKSICKNNSSL